MDVDAALALIAEPRRREIVRLVWDGERSAGDINESLPEITFGAVSQHLKRLRDAGLIEVRRAGRHRFYRARRTAFGPLAAALDAMWATKLDELKTLAEMEER
jgi:DNA-binding transcriptional ArsR family regulator